MNIDFTKLRSSDYAPSKTGERYEVVMQRLRELKDNPHE